MRSSRATGRIAALLVVSLLLLQVVPALASSVRGSGAAPSPPAVSPSAPVMTPDYLILGQLKGTTVDQSARPRSAMIPGFQYAATYYGAQDLQGAYGASSLISAGDDGRGETIAIIDAYGDPTIQQDLATFDREFGLPNVNLTIIPVGPYEPSSGASNLWDAEVALDVEAAHTMAPYAHINLVIAANASNALFEAVKLVVDRHLGDVVTMSWGLGENSFGESGWSVAGSLNYPYLEYYFQKGAAEGMSFFASSGDNGAFGGTTTVTAGWPATSPFVTGVGGTTLFLTAQGGYYSIFNSSATYAGEEAWSVSPQYVGSPGVSSGGGYSTIFPAPYYQAGVVGSRARASPDVAADANPYTGMVIVLEGGSYVIGGTSLASPLWAGMAADLDQYVGRSLGPLNPYLYSIYGNKAQYARDFHQVTYGFNGEYQAGPGYNLVTGLGSPDLPALAKDIRAQAEGLSVEVSTGGGSSTSAPAQFTYGQAVTISAAVTTPQGSTVSSGSFSASISDGGSYVGTVPMSYSGGTWTGVLTVSALDPPGQWTITVEGTSGGVSGDGMAEVNVGDSLGIIAPIPYPFAPYPLEPGTPFTIEVYASSPGGLPLANGTLRGDLVYEGRTVSSVPLTSLGGGEYVGTTTLSHAQPQGTYTLLVEGEGFATAYTFLYVGEGVVGVMLTPNDDAIPSAAPGAPVTFLAKALTASGSGAFTSNVTAKIYSLTGALMASVDLHPAPNVVQFGVFNLFGFQQANYTLPTNLVQGFYKLQFVSSYAPGGGSGAELGNFTTGFYVSGPDLTYTISTPANVYEGQYVDATAKILNSTGAPVTSGVFLATFIPSGYAYESYITDFNGYTSVPMVYDATLGAWYARFQIPSALTSPSALGNLPSYSSGPWTVSLSGESSAASNLARSNAYVEVLPYTYYTEELLDRTGVRSAPLVSVNGTGYSLSAIGADYLTIQGVNITLSGVSVKNLILLPGSDVWLDGSQVGSVTATNSTLVLAHGTSVGSLTLTGTTVAVSGSTYGRVTPALANISVTGLSRPLSGSTAFTVDVAGRQLTNGSLVGSVDGSPVALSATATAAGLTARGTIDAASLSDGVHVLTLTATQSDGLSSTVTTYFSVNIEGSSITTATDLSYAATALAVVALVAALLVLRRRPLAVPAPPPAPQV